MEVIAKAKYVRMSPRKVRLVIDLARGETVDKALNQLQFLRKDAAKPVKKLIESAIANAVNNFKLKKENLYIKKITCDGGPTLKRWHPRARGRAAPILKRTSHITIVLDETASQVTPLVKGEKSKHLKTVKSEIRSPDEVEYPRLYRDTKSETNSNDKKLKRLKV